MLAAPPATTSDQCTCLGEREIPSGPLYLKVTINDQQRGFYYDLHYFISSLKLIYR
ncbi:MAG: hypothetical protein GX050_07730 [Firmicutes bacterium]|nr:hypothetical protein [Bacillota bacterium]